MKEGRMLNRHRLLLSCAISVCAVLAAGTALAANGKGKGNAPGPAPGTATTCQDLPSWGQLRDALRTAVQEETSGLNNHMWGTIVDTSGKICAVAFSGDDFTDQWLG